jgi:hypothetical protein
MINLFIYLLGCFANSCTANQTAVPPLPAGPEAIKITGEGMTSEENVCDAQGICGGSARVEAVFSVSDNGTAAWGPLCAPDALNVTQQQTLANVVCNQVRNVG